MREAGLGRASAPPSGTRRIRTLLVGKAKDPLAPDVFHKVSLVAFLAWIGLGADGLSSSAYGPDEAFRALGGHTYLAVALAAATAFTVFIISYAYSRIIEHFPSGGGGYVVATKLLGAEFGVIVGNSPVTENEFGESRPIFRLGTEALDEALPDGRIVVPPGQRHAAHHTAPDRFVAEVERFLEPDA